jgi:hypothetical protein
VSASCAPSPTWPPDGPSTPPASTALALSRAHLPGRPSGMTDPLRPLGSALGRAARRPSTRAPPSLSGPSQLLDGRVARRRPDQTPPDQASAAPPDGLPPEAYASVAGLPGMGPARLTAVPPACHRPTRAHRRWSCGTRPRVLALGTAPNRSSSAGAPPPATDPAAAWRDLAASDVEVSCGRVGYPPVLVGDLEPPAVLFHRGDPASSRVLSRDRGHPPVLGHGRRRRFELGRDLARAGVVVSGWPRASTGRPPQCPRCRRCAAGGRRG